MPSQTVIDAANLLQSGIPLLSLSAYLPQWQKIVTTKSSRDISLRAWLLWSLGSVITVFYAVVQYRLTEEGFALVFSSVALLLFAFATVALIVVYRRRSDAGPD